MPLDEAPLHICILGSGVVGLSTAFYLLTSRELPENSIVTLIEKGARIAPGASSYAGGFIAWGGEAWQAPASRSLAELSWKCHVELAKLLGGRETYGFRECGAVGLRVGKGKGESMSAYRILPEGRKQVVEGDWLSGERQDMAGEGGGGLGQLDPALFCQVLHGHLSTLGLVTLFADPISLEPLNHQRALHVRLNEPDSLGNMDRMIQCDKLIVSCGPWSAQVCETLNISSTIPISNLPGTSILIRPAPGFEELPSEAVFAGIAGYPMGVEAATSGIARPLSSEEVSDGFTRSPEFFPRSNGLVYVAGENSIPSAPVNGLEERLPHRLPQKATDVIKLLDQKLVARLVASAGAVSDALKVENGAIIEREQLCYRPVTPDMEPIIDEIGRQIWLAAGHGPWGITLSSGTGKVMAELVLAKEGTQPVLSADISKLRLARF